MRKADALNAKHPMQKPSRLTQQLEKILGDDPWPAGASEACALAERRPLDKGQALQRAGDRWQHLWWIESGALRMYFVDIDGQSHNKNFYLEGAFLWPITPTLAREPVHFWVEALEPSIVWALPWAEWKSAVQDFAPWAALEKQMLSRLLEDKMQREHEFLQRSATERYQDLLEHHPAWAQRVPLKHIASFLGITDVALSRIRRRLAETSEPLNPG
ncbi:Crp/Fnr family transcriptional regulator [Hydrogenophaga sp. 5NK40-0174]|uniref:Crp/Fnr family transcriptional regulator n=1 Tax=Hydrogenophaga sp. 5NK40-0174 TaxID=3127649 RepID=UPI00310A1E9C